MRGICGLAEDRLASQERLCSMENCLSFICRSKKHFFGLCSSIIRAPPPHHYRRLSRVHCTSVWHVVRYLTRVFTHLVSATCVTAINASFHAICALHYILNTQLYALGATHGTLHSNTWLHVLCAVYDVTQYFARDCVIYCGLALTCGTAHARACT
jgi:hypothetical protein